MFGDPVNQPQDKCSTVHVDLWRRLKDGGAERDELLHYETFLSTFYAIYFLPTPSTKCVANLNTLHLIATKVLGDEAFCYVNFCFSTCRYRPLSLLWFTVKYQTRNFVTFWQNYLEKESVHFKASARQNNTKKSRPPDRTTNKFGIHDHKQTHTL